MRARHCLAARLLPNCKSPSRFCRIQVGSIQACGKLNFLFEAGAQQLSTVQIEAELEAQLADPTSALLHGTVTSDADSTASVDTTMDVAEKCGDGGSRIPNAGVMVCLSRKLGRERKLSNIFGLQRLRLELSTVTTLNYHMPRFCLHRNRGCSDFGACCCAGLVVPTPQEQAHPTTPLRDCPSHPYYRTSSGPPSCCNSFASPFGVQPAPVVVHSELIQPEAVLSVGDIARGMSPRSVTRASPAEVEALHQIVPCSVIHIRYGPAANEA